MKRPKDEEIVGFSPIREKAEPVDVRRDILEREAVRGFIREEINRLTQLEHDLTIQLVNLHAQARSFAKLEKSELYLLRDNHIINRQKGAK